MLGRTVCCTLALRQAASSCKSYALLSKGLVKGSSCTIAGDCVPLRPYGPTCAARMWRSMPFARSFAAGPPSRSLSASGSASPGLSFSIRNLRRRRKSMSGRHALQAWTTSHTRSFAYLRNEFNRFDVERPRKPLLFAALQTLPIVMCGLIVLSSPGMQLRLVCHIMMMRFMRLQASRELCNVMSGAGTMLWHNMKTDMSVPALERDSPAYAPQCPPCPGSPVRVDSSG